MMHNTLALYQPYQSRSPSHANSPPSRDDYLHFFTSVGATWLSWILELPTTAAVAVVDVLEQALSSSLHVFEPDLAVIAWGFRSIMANSAS